MANLHVFHEVANAYEFEHFSHVFYEKFAQITHPSPNLSLGIRQIRMNIATS